ncbi:t-SNARE [Mycena filopes]|nr:t-SNARE [Mycena filopes]
MPIDRKAAYKAQHQADQPPTSGGGGGHELATLGDGNNLDSMPAFLSEASAIQDAISEFSGNITRISALNARVLNALGEEAPALKAQLDRLVGDTMALSAQLKDRITRLQGAVGRATRQQERGMRQNRATHVRTKFTDALQTYRQNEQDYQAKSRTRVERQYRIVKPDATPDEINEAVSGGGDQVFLQALSSSSQYAEARSALSEVQARAQDLRRLEQTLGELAQLFSDMAVLVQQQDETVVAIESGAIDVEANTAAGLKETTRAVQIARALRKKRWICFFIVLVIVIILAAVLAVELRK